VRREQGKRIALGLVTMFWAVALQSQPLVEAKHPLPKSLEEQRKQIERGQQAVETMQTQQRELEQQIMSTTAEQQRLEEEIMSAMTKAQELQRDLTDLETRVKEQDEALKKRLRLIYQRGDVSLLEVLLDSEDFTDFVDRYQMLVLMVEKDKQLLKGLESDQQTLEKVRVALEVEQQKRQEKQQDLLALEARLQQQLTGLSVQITAKQQAVSEAQKLYQKRLEVNEAEKLAIVAYSDYKKLPHFQKYIRGNGKRGDYLWPVPTAFTISSPYGMRGQEFHNGIDIAAPLDAPIVAAADGVVLYAGAAAGFGHWVVLAHENGMLSVYGHMYENGVLVKPGQEVKAGELIAKVGNDGHSSGPHLHFALGAEITADGLLNHVNPIAYLQ